VSFSGCFRYILASMDNRNIQIHYHFVTFFRALASAPLFN